MNQTTSELGVEAMAEALEAMLMEHPRMSKLMQQGGN